MNDAEKLVRSTKRVIAKTSQGKLAALIDERRRWQTKATRANNRLAEVQAEIETMAREMAAQLLNTELQ